MNFELSREDLENTKVVAVLRVGTAKCASNTFNSLKAFISMIKNESMKLISILIRTVTLLRIYYRRAGSVVVGAASAHGMWECGLEFDPHSWCI